jgi:uncharacterized protein YbjT (DUF2867 family)
MDCALGLHDPRSYIPLWGIVGRVAAVPDPKTVLVAGATGRLGVVVDALVARGHSVRAMTRDPTSPAASRLREIGGDLVYADFEDRASIEDAARGVDALFATGTAHRSGPEGELRHGRNLAEAAAAVGVPHLIFVSGDGADPDSPVPLFRVKAQVEEHIRSLGIPHTILAPAYFMENLFNPWNLPALRTGIVPSPVAIDLPLQQVAVADVAAFAALAIERPAEFRGRRIKVASDQLTGEQASAALSRVTGRSLEAARLRDEELPPGLRALFGWLEQVGHGADVGGLRRDYPEVGWQRYLDWAESQRARFEELCSHPSPVAH